MAEVTTTSRRPPRARKAAAPVVETQVSLRDRILAAMRELTVKGLRKGRGKTDVVAWGSLDPAVGFGDVDAYRDELAAMVEAGLLEEVGGGFRLPKPGERAPVQVTEAERDAAALAAMERNVLAAIGDDEATVEELAVELGIEVAAAIVLVEPMIARRVLRKARSSAHGVWYAVNGNDRARLVAYLIVAGTFVRVEAMASQAVLTVERAAELAEELTAEGAAAKDTLGAAPLYMLTGRAAAASRELPPSELSAAPEPTPPATVVEAPRRTAEESAHALEVEALRVIDEESNGGELDADGLGDELAISSTAAAELLTDLHDRGVLASRVVGEVRWYRVGGTASERLLATLSGALGPQSAEVLARGAVVDVDGAQQILDTLATDGGCVGRKTVDGVTVYWRAKPKAAKRTSKAAPAPAPVASPALPADEDPRVAHLPVWLNSPDGHAAVPHRLAPASAVAVLPLLSPDQRSLA
jgi:hypothetical protein